MATSVSAGHVGTMSPKVLKIVYVHLKPSCIRSKSALEHAHRQAGFMLPSAYLLLTLLLLRQVYLAARA